MNMNPIYEKLEIGQDIYFEGESVPMKLRARSNRYAIVTRGYDPVEEADLLEEMEMTAEEASEASLVYSLLDFQEEKKAPNDRIFDPYNYEEQADLEQCIADLEEGKINLSKRHGVALKIDWPRTTENWNRETE
jgi:hypothetical protein